MLLRPRIYPVKKVEKRQQSKFVVITTLSNLSVRLNPMSPDMKLHQGYYFFDKVSKYFRERLEYREIPFHYYLNEIKGDWNTFIPTPYDYRSVFLKESVEQGYLPFWFKDAILIVVQDNYSIRIPDDRVYDMMASKVLDPLLSTLKVGRFMDSVFWLDEVFDFNKYNADKELYKVDHNYKYDVQPMKYFDRVIFNLQCRKYLT